MKFDQGSSELSSFRHNCLQEVFVHSMLGRPGVREWDSEEAPLSEGGAGRRKAEEVGSGRESCLPSTLLVSCL